MASKFIAKYPVPDEFPDILHDFAREVLRDQPEDIYEYGAQYFKALYNVSHNSKNHSRGYRSQKIAEGLWWILRGKNHFISYEIWACDFELLFLF